MNAQLIVELSKVGAVTSGKKSALIDHLLAYHRNNNFVFFYLYFDWFDIEVVFFSHLPLS